MPTSPAIAISAERDREAAVADVVHAGRRDPSRTSVGDELVHRRGALEIGDGRHPAVEAVHDRGPFRTAELGADRAEHDDVVAGAHGCGGRALVQLVDQPEHARDRRGVDVVVARRVVEADVAADHRDAERLARLAHPLDDLGELPHHLGMLGVAEVEAVHERDRPRADARDVARGFEHDQPAARARDRAGRSAPCRRSTARAPCFVPLTRSTAASAPGPATVFRNSWWSYWRDTHVLSAIVGVASSASSSRGEVGARPGTCRAAAGRDRRPATRPASAGRATGR